MTVVIVYRSGQHEFYKEARVFVGKSIPLDASLLSEYRACRLLDSRYPQIFQLLQERGLPTPKGPREDETLLRHHRKHLVIVLYLLLVSRYYSLAHRTSNGSVRVVGYGIIIEEPKTMPALDRYHIQVRNALVKDGWTITDDPLTLQLDERNLYVDFGAERLLAAERGTEKIAVEIKAFRNPSPIADLEQAIGQYGLYEDVLQIVEPDRVLYLAIPEEAFREIFSEPIGQLALQNRIRRVFTFDSDTEEIIQWIP
jgi:hypothetical protein